MAEESCLSKRGSAFVSGKPHPLPWAAGLAQRNPYGANNKEGIINFGTAENSLVFNDYILPKLKRDIIVQTTRYNDSAGTPVFRAAVAKYIEHFFHIPNVDPEDVGIATGSGAVMDALTWSLCEEGDVVLVSAAPYYGGFDIDCVKRSGAVMVAAESKSTNGFRIEREALEDAWRRGQEVCDKTGKHIRYLLLTNPTNPAGHLCDDQELQACIDFCVQHDIHLVSDEIYALSVHEGEFKSIFTYDMSEEFRKNKLHLVYGIAKDLGLSGLHVGIFYSPNRVVSSAVRSWSFFSAVSTDTQYALLGLFQDIPFLDDMFAEYRKRLKKRYDLTCKLLAERNISYMPSQAAFFIMLDLRPYVSKLGGTEEAEVKLFKALIDNKVYVAAGSFFKCKEWGWFRLVYTGALDEEELVTGLDRIAETLKTV